MRFEESDEIGAKLEAAALDLRELIEVRYPTATFDTFYGEDPDGLYLRVTVDVEDTDEVMDVVIDQLYEYQVEQGLPVHVLPLQPLPLTS